MEKFLSGYNVSIGEKRGELCAVFSRIDDGRRGSGMGMQEMRCTEPELLSQISILYWDTDTTVLEKGLSDLRAAKAAEKPKNKTFKV